MGFTVERNGKSVGQIQAGAGESRQRKASVNFISNNHWSWFGFRQSKHGLEGFYHMSWRDFEEKVIVWTDKIFKYYIKKI